MTRGFIAISVLFLLFSCVALIAQTSKRGLDAADTMFEDPNLKDNPVRPGKSGPVILSEAKDLCNLLGLGKLHRSFASLRMTPPVLGFVYGDPLPYAVFIGQLVR